MIVDDALRLGEWRYPGQWSVYDIDSPQVVLDELDQYWAVTDACGDSLVGFVCAGAAARVPGLNADPVLLDVGVGMSPDLAGQGRGSDFGRAVLEHLARHFPGRPLRAVIQAWNERSLRFAASMGFVGVGELVSSQGGRATRYRIVAKGADGSSKGLLQSGLRLVSARLVLRDFVAEDEDAVHSFAADPLAT
jgi:[ribosomal protein S18]-alanine N-acetyltransferase